MDNMNKRRILVGDYKIGKEEKEVINEILDSNRISEGRHVAYFEKIFADIIGVKHCVLTNSGTSALIAGLTALLYDKRYPKIKKGAKVITTPMTYIATSNAIKLVGLEPVFIDVNLDTFDMNVGLLQELLESSDSDEYCMILPVHLMGYPCDMDEINRLARKYDLVVFEDTAQAHGSVYKGKTTGTMSLLADYSFYIAHNIQVGEMGCVVTDDDNIHKLVKKIKANGRMCDCFICNRANGHCPKKIDDDPRFLHEFIGYNFKTMEFQAGLGLVQLDKFDNIIETRQFNVKYLNNGIENLASVKKSNCFILPKYSEDYSYLAYPIIIKDKAIKRDVLREKLKEYGIESRPLFGSIPTRQPAYAEYKESYKDKLPNADYLSDYAFYIGCHQYLDIEDLEYIIKCFDTILDMTDVWDNNR